MLLRMLLQSDNNCKTPGISCEKRYPIHIPDRHHARNANTMRVSLGTLDMNHNAHDNVHAKFGMMWTRRANRIVHVFC